LAFDLARGFQADHAAGVEVKAFPVDDVVLSGSLSAMAARTLDEGCAGESAAVARLAYALSFLQKDSPARAVVEKLMSDEARHAALAWATIRWAAGLGAAAKLHRPLTLRADGASTQSELHLTWAGRVPSGIALELSAVTDRVWVAPWAAAFATGADRPPKVAAPAGSIGDAVAKAAHLVTDALLTRHAKDGLIV